MTRANKAEFDYRILAFNTGHFKNVWPTREEYDMLNKAKKKFYYKVAEKIDPDRYYDPEEHIAKSRLPKEFRCGINGCEKVIKGLSNIKRHRKQC